VERESGGGGPLKLVLGRVTLAHPDASLLNPEPGKRVPRRVIIGERGVGGSGRLHLRDRNVAAVSDAVQVTNDGESRGVGAGNEAAAREKACDREKGEPPGFHEPWLDFSPTG